MNFIELNKLVITLPERTDRIEQFKKELVYLPCSNLQYVSGIKHEKPYLGIAQAHLNCILIAKQCELPYVLIMEDDVKFQGKEKTYDYLLNCLADLPPDWNILLGGVYTGKTDPYNKYWDKVQEFCGLHFYIVNSNCYDKILEYDGIHHIDRWMNHKGKRLNCYVTNKFIATQHDGYSDNVKLKVDYSTKLVKYKLL